MDTDTREEFYEKWSSSIGDIGWVDSIWDFMEQKLKQARIDEIDRAYESGELCRCYGEKVLAVPFKYFSDRLSELKGEQL